MRGGCYQVNLGLERARAIGRELRETVLAGRVRVGLAHTKQARPRAATSSTRVSSQYGVHAHGIALAVASLGLYALA